MANEWLGDLMLLGGALFLLYVVNRAWLIVDRWRFRHLAKPSRTQQPTKSGRG